MAGRRLVSLTALLVALCLSFPALAQANGSTGFAVTNKDSINLRDAPGGKLVEKLPIGKDVYVFEEKQDADGVIWYHVNTIIGKYNRDGWVRGDLLTLSRDVFYNITQIAAGDFHLAALRADGTVVAMGDTFRNSCAVSGWTDITAIGACFLTTLGVRGDGAGVSTGFRADTVNWWSGLSRFETAGDSAIGFRTDGSLITDPICRPAGFEPSGSYPIFDTPGIVDAAMAFAFSVFVKPDGTVGLVGDLPGGVEAVAGWTDLVAVEAGNFFVVGLKGDGTVVAAGVNEDGPLNLSGWRDIVAISASGYGQYVLGLKRDGTVVAAGRNKMGQCDVSGWTNMVAIDAAEQYAVGLKGDGTVEFAGEHRFMGR